MDQNEQTQSAFSGALEKGLSYTDLLFKNIFGGTETPEQAPQEEGFLFSLPEIDGAKYDPMSLPSMAMPEKDPIVGRDELGFNIRETATGVRYQIQPVTSRDISLSERGDNIVKNVGAAYEAVTEDPLGTATGLAKGIAQGVADTVSSFSDPNATKQDAMNIAGMVMGASAPRLLDAYDPNVTRIFAGENAKNFPRGRNARAQRLLTRGEDPQKIYEETGIEFLPQTERNFMRPVFSIDPEGMSVRDFDALQQVIPTTSADQLARGEGGIVRLPIKDVVDFSEFYDNYPQVEGFEVAFNPDMRKDTANFDAKNKLLNLSMANLNDATPDKIRSSIIHELQHGVQAVEGTPGGAASQWFLDRTLETNPRTGKWEKVGSWRTAAKDMSQDVDELNKLEQASKDAMKAYVTGSSNNLSSEELDKLARKADSAVNAFVADRDRLERLAFKKYQENQGEIEARAAQLWAKLTPEERLKTKPSDIYNRVSDNFGTPYARLGEEPFYGDNYMPTGRLPANNEEELRERLNTDVQMLNRQDFKVDNPGGEWLEGKQKRASEYPDRKFMVGSTTGVIGGNSSIFLPTSILKDIPGLADEKRSKGDTQYDNLLSDAKENGFDPDQKGNKIVVAVNHFGQPYLLEGNTRVAVANALNVPRVKVEVRYWNGAEDVDGPMNPEKVFGFASENPDNTSTNQRFAKGGMVEEEQMNRLMQEGGMADDGMSREPVTGNNIPPGALASEVRDNVDAKLSGGEYVVPADVLRYYGVRFFEDLRSQAKQGMMEMESAGRIGGVPVDPRGVPMQGQDEELTPEEEQMLAQAMSSTSGMAEGGDVFNRGDFTMTSNAMTSKLYFNPTTGKKQTINFLGDKPLGGIPDGFVPWTQALQDSYDATKPATPTKPKKRSPYNDDDEPVATNSYDEWADENYEAITNDPFKFGMDLLKTPNDDGGVLGILTGKDRDILNVAGANAALKRLEAQGKVNSPEYVALAEEVKKYVGGLSLVEKGLLASGVVGMGNQYDAALDRKAGKTPPPAAPVVTPPVAPPAAAPAAVPAAPRSGGQSADARREGGGGGTDSVAGGANNDSIGTSYNSPFRRENDRDQQSGSSTPPTNTPAPTPTRTVNTPSGPQEVRVQAGSERFAEGGLVTKPKKTRAKTKGLAGKQ